MSCLLKFNWVKLPRDILPPGKGLMGAWAHLATRAAFRPGQANYCGYRNDVELASWVGGMVGLKSILDVNSRQKAIDIMDALTEMDYISYSIDKATKKLSYAVKDWVVECSGAACADGAIYATDGYGFLCLPRNITQRLAEAQYQFEESDAWLDLWCHTVWRDPNNVFSHMAPAIQFGREGVALTLERLGARWGWKKTKVWRFLQKHGDVFPLRKLPGSYGCLVFNARYSDTAAVVPENGEIVRILGRIRILGQNTYFEGTDNQRLNRMIAAYSRRVVSENRVALPLYTRILLCVKCKNCSKDCQRYYYREHYPTEKSANIRDPSVLHGMGLFCTIGVSHGNCNRELMRRGEFQQLGEIIGARPLNAAAGKPKITVPRPSNCAARAMFCTAIPLSSLAQSLPLSA